MLGIARVCVKEVFSFFCLEMQTLVRSKTLGVTGYGGRGTAGAGPCRDLLYGSRGVPAPYRRTGDLGPHEPCPRTPRVQIVESVKLTPDWEA